MSNVNQNDLWRPLQEAMLEDGRGGPDKDYAGYYALRCPECGAKPGAFCGGHSTAMPEGVCVLRVKYWQLMGFPAHPHEVTELHYKMVEAALCG